MRILHLIDGASPQASPTTLTLLNESLGRLGYAQERVLLMGARPCGPRPNPRESATRR